MRSRVTLLCDIFTVNERLYYRQNMYHSDVNTE